jgi:hypothetical protein
MKVGLELFNGNYKGRVVVMYDERQSLVGGAAPKDNAAQTKAATININKFLRPRKITLGQQAKKRSETTITEHKWRIDAEKTGFISMNIDKSLADEVQKMENYVGDIFIFKKNIRLILTLIGAKRVLEFQFLDAQGNQYFTFGVAVLQSQINAIINTLEYKKAVNNQSNIIETKDDKGCIIVKQVTIQN